MTTPLLRIGTRGSPLALKQAGMVRDRLASAHGVGAEAIEIRVITTTGDVTQDRPLADIGGKGLFTKEIEAALARGEIDVGVHSAKDMEGVLARGLILAACLPREDARDVFVSLKAGELRKLSQGATLGTSSPRRAALVKRIRRDIVAVPLRGNVETRLKKLRDGVADATILAIAGLKRLGLDNVATAILDPDEFLPAVGQGAIAIETREGDDKTRELVAAIDDADTSAAVRTERAFLAALEGTCKTPIAGHARVVRGEIQFRGMIVKPDGSEAFEASRTGQVADAASLGADAGRELKARGGANFFGEG